MFNPAQMRALHLDKMLNNPESLTHKVVSQFAAMVISINRKYKPSYFSETEEGRESIMVEFVYAMHDQTDKKLHTFNQGSGKQDSESKAPSLKVDDSSFDKFKNDLLKLVEYNYNEIHKFKSVQEQMQKSLVDIISKL